jgi:hypothetical protein
MATSQIQSLNISGEDLTQLLQSYQTQKQQAAESGITGEILATGDIQKLGGYLSKGKKAIEQVPANFEKLGNVTTAKFKELSGVGDSLLEQGKKSASQLIRESQMKAKDIASLGQEKMTSQFKSASNSASDTFKSLKKQDPHAMMAREFERDPEVDFSSVSEFGKSTAKEASNLSGDFQKALGNLAKSGESATKALGREALGAGKAALGDVLSAVGEATEPLLGIAEAAGGIASMFGAKAPTMPNISIPSLSVL